MFLRSCYLISICALIFFQLNGLHSQRAGSHLHFAEQTRLAELKMVLSHCKTGDILFILRKTGREKWSAFFSYINTSVFIVGNQTEVVFLGIFNLSGMSNYICLLITVPVELSLFVLLFFKPRSSSQAGRLKVVIFLFYSPPLKGRVHPKIMHPPFEPNPSAMEHEEMEMGVVPLSHNRTKIIIKRGQYLFLWSVGPIEAV